MSTRTKNNVRVMRKVAESKIIDNIEGGENIEGALEASEMAVRPIKGIVNEGNRIRKKAQVSKLQKEVVGSRLRKRAVNKGRELAKKSGRKAVKKTSKKMAKDTGRKVAKESTKIATKAGCPIVPIAIHNSAGIFEAQFPKMRPAKVIVEYGEPIYPDKLDKEEKRHIGAYTQNVILEMLKEMNQ